VLKALREDGREQDPVAYVDEDSPAVVGEESVEEALEEEVSAPELEPANSEDAEATRTLASWLCQSLALSAQALGIPVGKSLDEDGLPQQGVHYQEVLYQRRKEDMKDERTPIAHYPPAFDTET